MKYTLRNKANKPGQPDPALQQAQSESDALMREKAEKLVNGNDIALHEDVEVLTPDYIRKLLHELRVHQIELEMQNEELRRVQAELEATRARYFDLYDLAPVGYVTINEKGIVLESNLTASTLLGVDRNKLVNHSLSGFILKKDQDIFYLKKKELFNSGLPNVFELQMLHADGTLFWVKIECTRSLYDNDMPVARLILLNISERKIAEQEVLNVIKRYETLIEKAPDGFVLVSPAGSFMYASQSARKMFGFGNIDISTVSPNNFTHPDDLPFVLSELGKLMRDPYYTPTIQYRFRNNNGEWRWIESTFRNLLSDPKIEAIVINFRDINLRKQAEQALHESEANLRAVFNATDESVFLVASDGTLLALNEVAAERLGKSKDALLHKKVFDILPSELVSSRRPLIDHALNAGKIVTFEDYRNGIWMLNRLYPIIENENETPVGLAIFSRDITESKRAEEALVESEEKFRSITEQSGDLIAITDPLGIVTYASPATKNLFGYAPEEMCGRNFTDFLDENYVSRAVAAFRSTLGVGAFTRDLELKCKRKDGTFFNAELSGTYFNYGNEEGTLVIIRDISRRKIAEEKLHETQVLLEASVESAKDIIIFSIDRDYRFLYFNSAHAHAMKSIYGSDVAIGMSVLDCTSIKEDRDKLKHSYDHVFAGNSHTNVEQYGDFERNYYESRYSPIRGDDGEIIGLICFASNINKRIESEMAIMESERRFREMLENIELIAVSVDLKGNITFLNEYGLQLTGWKEEEVTGKNWFQLFVPEYEHIESLFMEATRTGKYPLHHESSIITRDGMRRLIVWNNTSLLDKNGKMMGSSSIGVDITDRLQAESALRKSEEQYRSLFENMQNGFAYCRMHFDENEQPVDFEYIAVNNALEQLTGLKNVEGMKVSELIPGLREQNPEIFDFYGRVALTGEPGRIEINIKALSLWLNISAFSIKKGFFVAIFDDITERRHSEDKIKSQVHELQRWHEVTLGREDRNRLLKHEVNDLLLRLGEPIRYPSQEGGLPIDQSG
jgi:PAS domain S-box-containing protein